MKMSSWKFFAILLFPMAFLTMTTAAYSQNIYISDKTGIEGDNITISVLINNAPNDVQSFGMEVVFDNSRLAYQGFSVSEALVEDWSAGFIMDNLIGDNVVRLAGMDAVSKIGAGTDGTFINLTFEVVQEACSDTEQSSLFVLQSLADNFVGWTTGEGSFLCKECVVGETQSCNTGLSGICTEGVQICDDTGRWGGCVQNKQPSEEICDGIDNNCDDSTDEGVDSLCNDGNPCTDDTCGGQQGCQYTNNADPCDDGFFCTESDICSGGSCGGQAKSCDDGVGCTDDNCDEANDQCINTADNANCDDGQWCNGAETCDPVNDCQSGTAPDCSDGIACTDDSCDEVNDQCINTANNAKCGDDNTCTDDICDPDSPETGADGCVIDPIEGCFNVVTPAGNDVTIFDLAQDGIEIWFEQVNNAGVTTVFTWTDDNSEPRPPANFKIAGNYFDLISTVDFSGRVEICFNYDNTALDPGDEAELQLLHYETDHWVDVTLSPVDTYNNIVCGEISGFSEFVMGTPNVDEDGDGFQIDVDCNDSDPNVNPGATEVCGDGIDNDCAGGDAPCDNNAVTQSGSGGSGSGGGGCSITQTNQSTSTGSAVANIWIMFLPLIIFGIRRYAIRPKRRNK